MNIEIEFNQYIDKLCDSSSLISFNRHTHWNEVEYALKEWHFALITAFCSKSRVLRVPELMARPQLIEDDNNTIRLTAVNWRGLFIENGRRTELEPCGDYYSKCEKLINNDSHKFLYNIYLNRLGKAESINQLFLSETKLDSLLVFFSQEDGSSSFELTGDGKSATIKLTKELTNQLVPLSVLEDWANLFHSVLTQENHEFDKQGENINYTQISEWINNLVIEIIANNYFFFKPLRDMLWEDKADEEILKNFMKWLRSLAWLRFFCNSEVAGEYFYTARLPHIDGLEKLIPHSSVSIVSSYRLSDEISTTFTKIPYILNLNEKYVKMKKKVAIHFQHFKDRRNKDRAENDSLLALKIYEHNRRDNVLPLDVDKLIFVLKVADILKGASHERASLHFSFLLGFSHNYILSRIKSVRGQLKYTTKGHLKIHHLRS